jgi:hypothetical protein
MRTVGNKEFENIYEQYQATFERYFRHLKVAKIDKEYFRSEFQYILLRSMMLFDLDKATADTERFERYFISALKKKCNSIKRTSLTKRRKEEKYAISFCMKKHDIPDTRIIPIVDQLSALDVVNYCSDELNDKGIIGMLWNEYSVKDVCKEIGITPQEYRSIIGRIRVNSLIQKAVSRD